MRARFLIATLGLALLWPFLPARAADAASSGEMADADGAEVRAIWKAQELTFYFQSFTTFYACTSLEDKIERILRQLGAQARVRVRSPECPSVARTPRVLIQVISPVEATPDNIKERDKNKSTRELAERVSGKRTAPVDLGEEFAAQWRSVSLSRGSLDLQPGDCDLVQELRRKVLPKLAVRIVEDDLLCSPNQLSMGQPRLRVEALVERKRPDATNPSGDESKDAKPASQEKTPQD